MPGREALGRLGQHRFSLFPGLRPFMEDSEVPGGQAAQGEVGEPLATLLPPPVTPYSWPELPWSPGGPARVQGSIHTQHPQSPVLGMSSQEFCPLLSFVGLHEYLASARWKSQVNPRVGERPMTLQGRSEL